MIRTVAVLLLFAGVALRALVYFADDPQRPAAVAMLTAYGLLLFTGPRIIHPSNALHHKPTMQQALTLPFAYLLLQAVLVSALLRVPTTRDFIANLFIPLSLEAVLYFGRRTGFLWIAAFSLSIIGPLVALEEGPIVGITLAAFYSGLYFLFGGYADQIRKAETARRHNQRLIIELQTAHRQLEGYVSRVEELAAEQERGRLARELHDSVTQTVFSMNLAVQGAILLLSRGSGRVIEQLDRLEALAANAMTEIQAIVSHLRFKSDAVEELPEALRLLAAERHTQNGLQVAVEVSGQRSLSAPVTIALYTIVKEALNNVSRHTGTDQAIVRLSLTERPACLEIEDRGLGFDPATALVERGHLGLAGMADRAEEIGWRLVIDSGRGRGTRIRVEERPPEGAE